MARVERPASSAASVGRRNMVVSSVRKSPLTYRGICAGFGPLFSADRLRAHDDGHVPVSYLCAGRSQRARSEKPCKLQWAIQDSNLGPLPYQRSALTD